jgi:hypothetical protein
MKDRWAVLCPARLLLFKEKMEFGSFQLALAVYPIINSEFKLSLGNGVKFSTLTICFSEQSIANQSQQKGPTITKVLYISDPNAA